MLMLARGGKEEEEEVVEKDEGDGGGELCLSVCVRVCMQASHLTSNNFHAHTHTHTQCKKGERLLCSSVALTVLLEFELEPLVVCNGAV